MLSLSKITKSCNEITAARGHWYVLINKNLTIVKQMIHNITYKAFSVTFPIHSYPSSWYFDFFTFEFEVDKCVSFVRVQPFHRRWNRDLCGYYYSTITIYNYSPKGRWIEVVHRDAKRQGIYLALFTDPEGDNFFSIYQISWIKLTKKVIFLLTFWCFL